MNLLKEIFANEVFPAIGCTEPISCAYAAAAAAEQLPGPVEKIELVVDPGTFKNGAAVTVPNADGEKGNHIAGALGAVVARSSLRLEILKDVTPAILAKAREMIKQGIIEYRCREDLKTLRVEVFASGGGASVHCIVSEGHTNITCLEKNGKSIMSSHPHAGKESQSYRDILKSMKLEELIREAIKLDKDDRAYIERGIEMNMAITEKGIPLKKTAYQIEHMLKTGIVADDLLYRVKLAVASAVDARMGGVAEPVMTSGGSGNQGTLAILVPCMVGRHLKVSKETIEESIAISHAVNSYIKCFIGELSVICGCAIAAAISVAIALVYQKAGVDMKKMTFAMDNVIGDLCGMICDGAKPGCSMKIISGADTAVRSAFMGFFDYGISSDDGVIGSSPEESIKNLSKVVLEGMSWVDPTLVHILQEKGLRRGRA